MSEAFANVLAFGMLESKIHWPLDDLARAQGTEDEIMQTFRHCRVGIRVRVDALLAEQRKG